VHLSNHPGSHPGEAVDHPPGLPSAPLALSGVEAVVRLEGVVVRLAGTEVLHGLTLGVRRGAVTGLLGPSGSGKTTLLRVVAGVQRVHAGRVLVGDEPPGSPWVRRRLGYMAQGGAVYPDLTAEENVRYFASLCGQPRRRAREVLAEVGLAGEAHRLVGRLSGGQRARVSLAAALVNRPPLLLLDEPTVGQDPLLREELWSRFRALAEAGTTLLVSSHVMDEAGRCDRLLLLRDGALLADTTPQRLRADTGTDDLDTAFVRLVRSGRA
jgi:ABC-2 type transport system ATP-binding protein